MMAPVAGSGSWPSWIARVSKSMRKSLRVGDALSADDARQARQRGVEHVVELCAHAGLGVERLQDETALGAVVFQVGATDEPVAPQKRKDVVAVHAVRLPLVDLDHVPEAEDPL